MKTIAAIFLGGFAAAILAGLEAYAVARAKGALGDDLIAITAIAMVFGLLAGGVAAAVGATTAKARFGIYLGAGFGAVLAAWLLAVSAHVDRLLLPIVIYVPAGASVGAVAGLIGRSLSSKVASALPQFSLRALLLAVIGCGVICSLLSHVPVHALAWVLKSNNRFSNFAAVNLAALESHGVVVLVEAIQDHEESVRVSAAYGLTQISPGAAQLHPKLIPALINALNDRNVTVRDLAAWALGRLGTEAEPAIPALVKATQDSDGVVQYRATEALERIRTGYRPAE